MKRILMLLSLLVLVLAISVSAAAEVVVAEDMQTIEINEETYVRANVSRLGTQFYDTTFTVVLPQAEQGVSVTASRLTDNTGVVRLTFRYDDGSTMTITYIREDLLPIYEQLLTEETCIMDFNFPAYNKVMTEKATLMGTPKQISGNNYDRAWTREVYVTDEGGKLRMVIGELLELDDRFLYVDYLENGITDPKGASKTLASTSLVTVYEITDEALLRQLNAAYEKLYGENLGWLEDESLSEQLTIVLIVVVFGMLPLAALITFTVFAIRSKKKVYRVLNLIVCGCALAVLLLLLLLVLLF